MIKRDKLQNLLSNGVGFSIFDEMVNFPLSTTKLTMEEYDKIEKMIVDIEIYLIKLEEMFTGITNCGIDDDLLWFLQARNEILELYQNMENIDRILNQLLSIIETNDDFIESNLLNKLDLVSDKLLNVKKFVFTYKKKLDIAMNYYEINDEIIKSLGEEIEQCLVAFFKLEDIKKISNTRSIPQFDLQTILAKLKIADLSFNYSMKSIRLPTFNDYDEQLYREYLSLISKISPLKISLSILPLKIDELNKMCSGGLFPNSRLTMINNYEKLLEKWNFLLSELKSLKIESLDSKWHEIFKYLMFQIMDKCQEIIEVDKMDASVSDKYRLCSNIINIINQSIKEFIIYDKQIIQLYSQNLLPKWYQVIEKITELNPNQLNSFETQQKPLNTKIDSKGLRTFNTTSNNHSTRSPAFSPKNNGFGLDLGINIESIIQNYSIEKMDKVQDFFRSSSPPILPSSKNLRRSLELVDQENEHIGDDMISLVKNTSNLTIQKKTSGNLDELFQKLTIPKQGSKLPIICQDYIDRGLPIIKKSNMQPRTRIPSISPEHPVFSSPDRIGLGLTFSCDGGSPRQPKFGKSTSNGDLWTNNQVTNGKLPNLLHDDMSKPKSFENSASQAHKSLKQFTSVDSNTNKFNRK